MCVMDVLIKKSILSFQIILCSFSKIPDFSRYVLTKIISLTFPGFPDKPFILECIYAGSLESILEAGYW